MIIKAPRLSLCCDSGPTSCGAIIVARGPTATRSTEHPSLRCTRIRHLLPLPLLPLHLPLRLLQLQLHGKGGDEGRLLHRCRHHPEGAGAGGVRGLLFLARPRLRPLIRCLRSEAGWEGGGVRGWGSLGGAMDMVIELLDCSLHELIAGPKGYSVPLCFRLAHEIAQGIAFLHRNNVLHRDIKPANVMLDALLHAKVCDFGLSRDITADIETRQPGDVGPQSVSHSTRRFGTLRYMAPEVLCLDDKIGSAREVKLRYNQQCDVYSFALLLWELAHREPPFMGTDATQVAQAARSGKRPQLRLPKGLADLGPLITSSWHVEPAQRPTMAACTEELLRLSQSPEASPVEGQLGAAEGGEMNAESSFKM